MGEIVHKQAFKSGNSTVVELPESFGIAPGMDVVLEKQFGHVVVRPKKQSIEMMIERLRALPDVGEVEVRRA
jgi:virulence-associated protein VagC